MKTFKDETRELFDWSTEELTRIDKEYPDNLQKGLDGPGDFERKKHFREYNKRLFELKAKYNIQ